MEEVKTRQLTPEERLSSFDKILLLTGHINLQANIVREVWMARLHSADAIEKGVLGEEKKSEGSFHRKLAKETEDLLKETYQELNTIYELLVDFCNGCDAVSDIDIQLGEPVYNAINDLVVDDGEEEQSDQPNGAIATEGT